MRAKCDRERLMFLECRDWLYQRYVVEGLSMRAIAREIGCSDSTVLYAIRRSGITPRPAGKVGGFSKVPELASPTWLFEALTHESQERVAESLGVSRSLVRYWMARHGIVRKIKEG